MIVVDTTTGLLLLGLGVAYRRRPAGWLLGCAGVAWFLGDVASWAVFLHRGPLVHLVLAYPYLRPRTRLAWPVIAAGYLCSAVPALTSGPVTVAVAAAVLGCGLHSHRVASGVLRRARLSALAAAAALAVAISAGAVLRLAGIAAGPVVQAGYDLIVAATAAALCADLRWGRWARAAVTGLVVDLGQSGPLRIRLARALGDPALVVGFWLPLEGRYVDEAGRDVSGPGDPPAARADGRVHTVLDAGGERVGVLVHDASVLADGTLVTDVAAAARLAMANIGLREQVRARAAEVEASRRRLVESADAARRDLAEDLRRGPGQRLDRIDRLLRGADPRDDARSMLIAGLDRARAVLRDLVVGIHPPALISGGLSAALPELVRLAPVPVVLRAGPGRYPAVMEAAGYFVCCEALTNIGRHAHASRAEIRIGEHGGALRIHIDDDGVGGARVDGGSGLRGLADRAAALGGTLRLDSPAGSGTRLVVELPLPGTGGSGQ